jgi:endonuclease/exonuclease/phosphatase family metal-dependent hydrolase
MAITRGGTVLPDVLCLQEVESLIALRKFNEEHIGKKMKKKYKYALVIDSRDFRQIDVGILSNLDILDVRSHVDDIDPEPESKTFPYVFSRDCLEIDLALNSNGSQRLTLFVNHLKSKLAQTPAERKKADKRRQRQAEAVRGIIRARFPGDAFNQALFAAVGDFNDEPGSPPVKPLVHEAGLVDPLTRLPQDQRWTHWYGSENSVSQLDYLLLSPALDAATQGSQPEIERRGLGFARFLANGKPGPKSTYLHKMEDDPNPTPIDFQFSRFTGVTPDAYASDHCPVFLEVP